MNTALKFQISDLFTAVPERSSGDEVCIICPELGCEDRNGNRSVNLKSLKTYCWRCGKGGDFFIWAKRLGFSVENREVTDYDADYSTMTVDRVEERTILTPLPGKIGLPKGFKPLAQGTKTAYYKLISRMARRKNLHVDDFVEAGAGYTREGKWEKFCIFPVLEYDHMVYFQGRTYLDYEGQPTKSFPNRKECPLGARYWLYGMDALGAEGAQTAIVVESILNVLSLRKRLRELEVKEYVPVCVFKHSISQPQAIKLARFKSIQEICILFDHDATAKAWDQGALLQAKYRVTVAEMPGSEGNSKMDANDAVDVALEAVCNRKKFSDVDRPYDLTRL